jgi:hypothetical protein
MKKGFSVAILLFTVVFFAKAQDSLWMAEYERRDVKTNEVQKYIRYTFGDAIIKIDFLDDLAGQPNVSRIVQLESRKVTALFPRQGLTIDGLYKGLDPGLLSKTTTSLSSESSQILGYDCNLVEQSFEGTQIKSWVSQSIPINYNNLVTAVLGLYEVLLPPGMLGLPLAWDLYDKEANKSYSVKVLRIEKIPVDKELFAVPEGYKSYKQ